MTKPIAQTFYINENIGGVEGVVLTRLDVYFEKVSTAYGVEVQIRVTDNGNPTSSILPRASKVIHVADTYASNVSFLNSSGVTKTIAAGTQIIQASDDASFPVVFEFDTPITLQSQTSYAFVIIPIGGNPDYRVWTAELAPKAGNDVTTGTPVYTNNDTGTLFLSSNDIQFTSIPGEDIKFTAYIANFTSQQGTAAYTPFPEEGIYYTNLIGSFQPSETMLLGNNSLELTKITTNANTLGFSVGETIYQSNGSANLATGVVFSWTGGGSSGELLITNSYGTFVTSSGSVPYLKVTGVTSGATGNVASANQSVISSSNTTLTVPFTGNTTANIFYANQSLYIASPDRAIVDCKVVDSVVNSTTVKLKYATSFSNTSSMIGQIRGDNLSLYARYSGPQGNDPVLRFGQSSYWASLYFSSSTSSSNWANAAGQLIIGFSSKSSALNQDILDFPYNTVIPDFTQMSSKSTSIDWTYYGIDTAGVYDSEGIAVENGIDKQLLDKPRILLSRSSEVINNSGNASLTLFANLTTSNTKFSPVIDGMMNNVRFARNFVASANQSSGYFVSTSNRNKSFNIGVIKGSIVSQSNGTTVVTGQILAQNPTGLYIANTSGEFQSGYSIYQSNNNTINAMAVSVVEYNEKYTANVFPYLPRYISKNVVLAENQDAEDLKLYLTAYRPANTNFQIYGKLLHNQDPDNFGNKTWSRLTENTISTSLISSGSNQDDFLELMYELPVSVLQSQNTVYCVSNSTTIDLGALGSTVGISQGDHIYLYNSSSNNFIVRQVNTVVNNSTVTLKSYPILNSTTFVGNGTISTTTLTVTSVTSGSLAVGSKITVASGESGTVTANSIITAFGTGTGGLGTYTLSQSSTISVANVLNSNSWSTSNADLGVIKGLEDKSGAFLYANNNNISRYVSNNDVVFDSFKSFAIKIVPVSDSTAIIPRAGDYRVLALQV